VDDESDIRELLQITLQRMDIQTVCAESLSAAKRLLQEQRFDLCLTDMRLPDGDGLSLLDYVQEKGLSFPVAVITAHGSVDTAIKAMKNGAFDFLTKPVDLSVLRQVVSNALQLQDKSTVPVERRMRNVLLGESEAMRSIRAKIGKVARSQAPVYISGESGSGKELVAKLIHQQSPRAAQPFIAINCGAIPPELMESEFFGYKKGSFTGATQDKPGLFQAADGGTLFLDEVADLPLNLQVKLLRAIQEKKIRPLGEQQEIAIDVRLLSATHKNLAQMVQEGSFRQDLYYRINVIEMDLPPLRARAGDIALIAEHLLERLCAGAQPPKLAPRALAKLTAYAFPGNVRELENILERALALYEGDVIDVDDLHMAQIMTEAAPQQAAGLVDVLSPVAKAAPEALGYRSDDMPLENFLEHIERQALTSALQENRWNKTATAKQLGMTFRSLRYRLKKLGLE
jgi:two-component system, NtrC family, response regulator PilR